MIVLTLNTPMVKTRNENVQICFCRNLLHRFIMECSLKILESDSRSSSLDIGSIDPGFLDCFRKYRLGTDRMRYDENIGNTKDLTEWSECLMSRSLSLVLPFPFCLDDSCSFPLHLTNVKDKIGIHCTFVDNPQKLLRMRVLDEVNDVWTEIPVDDKKVDIYGTNVGTIKPLVPDMFIQYLKMREDEILVRRGDQYSCSTETYTKLNVDTEGERTAIIILNNSYPTKYVFGMFEHKNNISLNNFSDYSQFPNDFIKRIVVRYQDKTSNILDIDGLSLETFISHLLPTSDTQNGFFYIPFCIYPSSIREDRAIVTSGNPIEILLTIHEEYRIKDYQISSYSVNHTHLVSEYDKSPNIGTLSLKV